MEVPWERFNLMQAMPASINLTISSVSELEGLYFLNLTNELPKCAYDLGLAFSEVDLSEDVFAADLLKLLFLFLLFFLLVLVLIVEHTALGGAPSHIPPCWHTTLRILVFFFFVGSILVLLLVIGSLLLLDFFFVCVHFISLT